MKTQTRKARSLLFRPFNMVEIVIALVIILVALIGVLGLLPDTIQRNADAMHRSAAIDSADQLLHFLASRIETDWLDSEALPDIKYDGDDRSTVYSTDNLINDSNLHVWWMAEDDTEADWGYNSEQGTVVNAYGVFKVAQTTNDASIKDFEGVVRVWKELYIVEPDGNTESDKTNNGNDKKTDDTSDKKWRKNGKVMIAHYPPGQGGTRCITLMVGESAVDAHINNHEGDFEGVCPEDLDADGNLKVRALVCVLNAEVSWPVQVPYEQRSKVTYQVEIAKPPAVFNPDEITAGDGTGDGTDDGTGDGTGDETDDGTGNSTVDDGEVVLNVDASTTTSILGSNYANAITATITINGSVVEAFGDPSKPGNNNVAGGGGEYGSEVLASGSTLSVTATSYDGTKNNSNVVMTKDSTPNNANVAVLKNGDSLPSQMGTVPDYLSAYVDGTTVSVGEDQVLILFELSTNDLSSAGADFSELGMLITVTP